MKKNVVYFLTLAFSFTCVMFVVYKYVSDKKRDAIVPLSLKERKGALADGTEWEKTRKTANYYTQLVRNNPGDTKAMLALASIFIQESRITGDYLYYDAAAMRCVKSVLDRDPDNFDALTLKALINLSQHHFNEGIAVAEKAVLINPYNAFVYGILVDGHVELGNYSKAVEYCDKMVSIRPDLRSYSRISYLREIHGDNEGAIEAMKLAVEAGAPGDEPTEWARVHLGRLYENKRDFRSAEMHYHISLDERPGYPYALAGMARVAAENKKYDEAIRYLGEAQKNYNIISFSEELINIYKQSGRTRDAASIAKKVVAEMEAAAERTSSDPDAGHYTDRELAMAYLEIRNNDKALQHALIEYNRRPQNIEVNETLAWVYYNRGEVNKAIPYLQAAMKTSCKNPALLSKAALILNQQGTANNY